MATESPKPLSIACLDCRERIAYRRGVCMACKHRQDAAIKRGETTDEQLVKEGKRAAAKKGRMGMVESWSKSRAWSE